MAKSFISINEAELADELVGARTVSWCVTHDSQRFTRSPYPGKFNPEHCEVFYLLSEIDDVSSTNCLMVDVTQTGG